MKAKILSVNKISNAQITVTFQILKNDGSLLLEATRGMVSLQADPVLIRAEIKQNFQNIRDSYQAEAVSVLNQETQKLIGQEVDIA